MGELEHRVKKEPVHLSIPLLLRAVDKCNIISEVRRIKSKLYKVRLIKYVKINRVKFTDGFL